MNQITADGPAHSSYITDNHAARSDTHQLLFRLSLASISAIAVLLFLLGVFLGVLCTKCAMKRGQQENNSMANVSHNRALMPIYEEVNIKTRVDDTKDTMNCKVEDNVAYGPIVANVI